MHHAIACSFLLLAGSALAAQQDPPKPAAPDETTRIGELSEKEFAALHELTKDKVPELHGTMIEIGGQHHYLSLPKDKKAPMPAVLVIHEWWGLNDHIKHWADRLAAEGYAALAVDLYGGKSATTAEEAMALMKGVEDAQSKATLHAAYEYLRNDKAIQATRVGSLGWCFGGGRSLQCAIHEPKLDACVLYYGQLVADPEQLGKIGAPVLGIFGARDRSIPAAMRAGFEAAMKKLDKPVRLLTYDAEHAFANPSGAHYDQKNAAAAWTEARAFLKQHLMPAPADEKPAAPVKR